MSELPDEIDSIPIVVTIFKVLERKQNFGQVSNSFVRIFEKDTCKQILKYDLEEDFSSEISVEVGKLYKKDNTWRFQAVGVGSKDGLDFFASKYI